MSILAGEKIREVGFAGDELKVGLLDGRTITVPLAWYPRLLNATPAQRKKWRISSGGYGIHWPDLDEDLSAEGLLKGAPASGQGRRLVARERLRSYSVRKRKQFS